MTLEEILRAQTQAARDAVALAREALANHSDACDRIAARNTSDQISKAAVELIRNPNS